MEGLGVRDTFASNELHTVSMEEGLEVEVSAVWILNVRAGNGPLGRSLERVARAASTDDTHTKAVSGRPSV
jgi:hypothetical protein